MFTSFELLNCLTKYEKGFFAKKKVNLIDSASKVAMAMLALVANQQMMSMKRETNNSDVG